MSKLIDSRFHTCETLKTYLLKSGWREETPSLLFYQTCHESYRAFIKLNLVTNTNFSFVLVEKEKNQMYRYELPTYELSLMRDIIQEQVQRLEIKAREVDMEEKMYEGYALSLQTYVTSKGARYHSETGTQVFELKNGLHCHVATLPRQLGFEYTIIQGEHASVQFSSHQEYVLFNPCSVSNFKKHINDLEQRAPSKNGWINPLWKEDTRYVTSYTSFRSGKNRLFPKVVKLRNILSGVFPEDWLFHLFVPEYRDQLARTGRFFLMFVEQKDRFKGEFGQQLRLMNELADNYPFVYILSTRRNELRLEIDLEKVNENAFKCFAQDVYKELKGNENNV